MLYYGALPKSKKKKPPKAVREQYDQWLLKHSPTKKLKPVNTSSWSYNLSTPPGRETIRHPSLNTGLGVAKLLTCGGMGIWTIVDWFMIMGKTRGKNFAKFQTVIY